MRVAALYDVHGNLPALEAVLADVASAGVDEIVVGGDVLWGPLQVECVTTLRSAGARFLAGNCERDVLGSVGFPSFADMFPPTLRGERTAKETVQWFESQRGA